ncbi:MAG: VOC family protein [Micrococcales bacterium]|nr:VOC family protein [Micrococcales bacterium]
MRLENIVIKAADPQRLGRFWAAALGLSVLTDEADAFEARLGRGTPAWLDVCLERLPDVTPQRTPRLHLDLRGGAQPDAVVERLLGLGAAHLDIGQGEVPWTVLADIEGNAFCVLEDRPTLATTGPLASLPLDVTDPLAQQAFWQLATGWVEVPGSAPVSLQHPSGEGPLLELCPELEPKAEHNLIHLDVRPEAGETRQGCVDRLIEAGASVFEHDWGELPWTVLTDPSGNEFCVLQEES